MACCCMCAVLSGVFLHNAMQMYNVGKIQYIVAVERKSTFMTHLQCVLRGSNINNSGIYVYMNGGQTQHKWRFKSENSINNKKRLLCFFFASFALLRLKRMRNRSVRMCCVCVCLCVKLALNRDLDPHTRSHLSRLLANETITHVAVECCICETVQCCLFSNQKGINRCKFAAVPMQSYPTSMKSHKRTV